MATIPTWQLGGRQFEHGWSVRWGVTALAVALSVVAGLAIVSRPNDSGIGPAASPSPTPGGPSSPGELPDALRHPWGRAQAITPDIASDGWYLTLAGDRLGLGRESAIVTVPFTVAVDGPGTLVVTSTEASEDCQAGTASRYRYVLAGSDTVVTLTPVAADACPARQGALSGLWVRNDLTQLGDVGDLAFAPGTYETSAFDPFGTPSVAGQLSYTIPAGWKPKDEEPATFMLHQLAGPDRVDVFVTMFARPRMAADFRPGFQDICGEPLLPADEVGGTPQDILDAIQARPGVTSTEPEPTTVDGYQGWSVDLRLDADWDNGCLEPGPARTIQIPLTGEPTRIHTTPILLAATAEDIAVGPQGVGIGPDQHLRLILLDLGEGRTLAIAVQVPDPTQGWNFDKAVDQAAPVIESFEFHPAGR